MLSWLSQPWLWQARVGEGMFPRRCFGPRRTRLKRISVDLEDFAAGRVARLEVHKRRSFASASRSEDRSLGRDARARRMSMVMIHRARSSSASVRYAAHASRRRWICVRQSTPALATAWASHIGPLPPRRGLLRHPGSRTALHDRMRLHVPPARDHLHAHVPERVRGCAQQPHPPRRNRYRGGRATWTLRLPRMRQAVLAPERARRVGPATPKPARRA